MIPVNNCYSLYMLPNALTNVNKLNLIAKG